MPRRWRRGRWRCRGRQPQLRPARCHRRARRPNVGFETQGLAFQGAADGDTQDPLQNVAPEFTDGSGAPITTFNLVTDEDIPLSGTFTSRDANGDLVTFSVTRGPANGTLALNPDGTWTYTPSQDYNGSDSFEVTVSDSRGASTPLTVNVGINPVNDAPSPAVPMKPASTTPPPPTPSPTSRANWPPPTSTTPT